MKEIIKIIFENKRYRAILYLCLYFIFFGVIFIITSIPSSERQTELTKEEKYLQDEIYNEKLYINNETIYININNGNIKISYNNLDFKEIDNTFKYNEIIPYLKQQYIYDLIKDKEYESKTYYKDGRIEQKYLINNIEISIFEKEKIIESSIKIGNNLYKIIY